MRFLLCAAATIAVLAPQAALAQQHDRNQQNNGQHHGRQQPANAHQRGPRETVSRTTTQVMRRNGADVQTRTTTRVRDRNGPRANVETRTRTQVTRNRGAGPGGRRVQRPAGFHPRHFERVHAWRFVYPRGYHYRRWGIGAILPRLFLSQAYYYNDWYGLGFGPPPPGYAWVRYGPDLLLVNIYTGRIRDVVYGVFY